MSLCPSANSTIIAGYVAAVEPYHASCIRKANWQQWCKRPGFVIELWQLLAKTLNCDLQLVQFFDFGAFSPDANNHWGGMMEALARGEIDATASHLSLSNARIEAFQSASVFGYAVHQFVARTTISKEREFNLAVFSWSIFALISLSIIVCGIIYHFREDYRYERLEALWYSCDELMHFVDRKRTLLSYFLALSFLLLQLIYFAEFRSRAVKEKHTETAVFDHLIEEFYSGRRKLIITNKAHVKDADKLLLFGKADMTNDSRLILLESYEAAIAKICENDEYLLLGNVIELRAIAKQYQRCNYGPIQITSASADDLLLYHMSSFVPHGILFGTHVNKKVVERMNEIILKLFKDEDFDSHWYPRYRTRFGYQKNEIVVMPAVPSSIGLPEVKDGFKFWLAGVGISTVFFITAKLYYRQLASTRAQPMNKTALAREWYLPKMALSAYLYDQPPTFNDVFYRRFNYFDSHYA